jgi:hypothetical protein
MRSDVRPGYLLLLAALLVATVAPAGGPGGDGEGQGEPPAAGGPVRWSRDGAALVVELPIWPGDERLWRLAGRRRLEPAGPPVYRPVAGDRWKQVYRLIPTGPGVATAEFELMRWGRGGDGRPEDEYTMAVRVP